MSIIPPSRQLAQSARAVLHSPSKPIFSDKCLRLSNLCLRQSRSFQTSFARGDVPRDRKDGRATTNQLGTPSKSTAPISPAFPEGAPSKSGHFRKPALQPPLPPPSPLEQTPEAAVAKAKAKMKEQQENALASSIKTGGLADNSLFSDDKPAPKPAQQVGVEALQKISAPLPEEELDLEALGSRNLANLAVVLNPRPAARARWQRRMVIREVRRRGRLTREMHLARTERSHLAKSHFFKTSMKKLAPLARQIAGKPIDEAILQMRFSVKKAARDVRKHLIQARDEAIAMKGMGFDHVETQTPDASTTSGEVSQVSEAEIAALENPSTVIALAPDPAITPPLPHQNPTKSFKSTSKPSPTSIYISQAWVNRGPYGQEPDYRARGRLYIMRPPHTGLSVVLKEEKTRTREKAEKEAKAIRRRMGKSMWLPLPDRKISKPQGQHVLW